MASIDRVACVESDRCNAKVWYIDDKPFSLGTDKVLRQHKCAATPPSSLPEKIFVGVWRNKITKRVRYTGPFKTEWSARKEPDDRAPWELISVLHATPDWAEMDDHTTIARRIGYGRFERPPDGQ